MRVTNKMLSNNFLSDMQTNLANMQTLQEQMTSGKEIRKPSDDPFKVARAMQLNSDINANKQFDDNIKDTSNWLDTTDTALGQVTNTMQRIRELLVSSGNASYGSQERQSIKDEINQRIGELTQSLNTNFDGKYIFGGSRGTSKPVGTITDANNNTQLVYTARDGSTLDTTTAQGQNELNMIGSKLSVEVSQGVTMNYNTSASDAIQFTQNGTNYDLRDVLSNITSHLDGMFNGASDTANANAALTNGDLTAVTDTINNILSLRSQVGAKENRMQSAQDKNEQENINLTQILSNTEDIDITQKTMEYTTAQTVYQASLQTSAKILQPSLIDYLK